MIEQERDPMISVRMSAWVEAKMTVTQLTNENARLRAVTDAAVAWVAAYREQPGGIMHTQWMAKATAERDARQRLHDAVDALTDGDA